MFKKKDEKYILGDKSIIFDKDDIIIEYTKYPKMERLLELLITKHPNIALDTQNDLNTYC